ncbi:MAG: MFS transporter [Gammaproteobacteria bacterium]|nr:MFS transporter [Gammaproteobacteria bacterium]
MKNILKLLLIREDEKITVLYFLTFFFIAGCGMAMGKASAEALFFKRYGIENLPLMYIALGVLLTISSLVYATLADKISAEKLFFRLLLILIVALLTLWGLLSYTEMPAIYPLYFLLYEAASEIMLVHMALYISQNLNTLKSKRLLPVILAGSQLGLITGGILVAILAPRIGTSQIMLIWSMLLFITLVIMVSWHKLKGPSCFFYKTRTHSSVQASLQSVKKGISFTRQSSLLSASSIAFFFMVITFYTLYYVTNTIYTGYFENEQELAAFFGILTATTALITLLLQLFVSNRTIEKLGIQNTNLIFPLSISLSFVILLLSMKMPAAIFASFIKDTFNPAFNSPVRNMMYNILPKNIQGRSRAVSTGIILPAALLTCALILLSAQFFSNSFYFLVSGFITSLLLVYFSIRTNKAYLGTLIKHLREQIYMPKETLSENSGTSLLVSLQQNIHQGDDAVTISSAKILIASHPDKATDIIIERLKSANSKTADQLIRILASHTVKPLRDILKRPDKYPVYDHHFEATMLQLLFEARDSFAKKYILRALISDNPRVWATGIYGAIVYNDKANLAQANSIWIKLSTGNNKEILAALPLVKLISQADEKTKARLINNYQKAFPALLESNQQRWRLLTLEALSSWQHGSLPDFSPILSRLFADSDPFIRAAVIGCSFVLAYDEHMDLLVKALDDGHSQVRKQALAILLTTHNNNDVIADNWLINNDNFTSPRAQLTIFEHLVNNALKETSLQKIADSKALLGRQYYDARQMLKSHQNKSNSFFLLYQSINERLDYISQLLLSCLDQLQTSNIASVVNAAIKTADKEHIATACEALSSLDKSEVTALLIDILRDDFELKSNYIMGFDNTDSVLNWCKLQDQWLQTCALRALNDD